MTENFNFGQKSKFSTFCDFLEVLQIKKNTPKTLLNGNLPGLLQFFDIFVPVRERVLSTV